jgi:hypothetical protein
MATPHPSRWRIRFSSAKQMGFVASGSIHDRIESEEAWARRWDSREAAVAHVMRYIDATIVSSADQLSTTSPTCFIEELP